MADDPKIREPLLGTSSISGSSSREVISDTNITEASENQAKQATILVRSTDDDVLLESAVVGRHMSWTSAWLLMTSRMVGSGIFASPGTIVVSVGSIGLSLTLWLIGASIAACSLAIALEFGCMLPRSGGEKVYLEYTYRKPRFLASILFALHAVVLVSTAGNCTIFATYALYAFGLEPSGWARRGLALGLLIAVTIMHGCFLKTGVKIQNTLACVKIVLMVLMIFTGFWVILFRHDQTWTQAPKIHALSSWDNLWVGSIWNFGNISSACLKIYYSFSGYTQLNQVMNEVKDPIRTMKTAGPAALLTVVVMYFFINIAYFVVVPLEEIKNSGELIAGLFLSRVFGPGLGTRFLPLLISISSLGNVMVTAFTIARVNQEVARQGFVPFSRYFASSWPFGTPLGGLLVHFVVCSLIITVPPSKDAFAFILDVEGYSGQFLNLAVAVGLLILRQTHPDMQRPFKAWTPAVWFRAAMCAVLIFAPFVTPDGGKGDVSFWYGTYALVTIGGMLLTILYWFVWTIALPRWKGYALEEGEEILRDGTSITILIKKWN